MLVIMVTSSAHVVVSKEPHGVCDAQVVVQEAGKEGISLVGAQVFLLHPVEG